MVQRVNDNVDFVTDDNGQLVGYQVRPGDIRRIPQTLVDSASNLIGIYDSGLLANVALTRQLAGSTNAIVVTGVSTETAAAAIVLPANTIQPGSVIRVTGLFRCTTAGNASNKSLKVKLGDVGNMAAATDFYSAGVTVVSGIMFQAHIFFRSGSQIGGMRNAFAGTGYSTSPGDVQTSAHDMTIDKTLFITLTPNISTDVLAIESYLVEIVKT